MLQREVRSPDENMNAEPEGEGLAFVCVVVSDHVSQEQNRLRQQCLHLGSRLDLAETERQREREVRGPDVLLLLSLRT